MDALEEDVGSGAITDEQFTLSLGQLVRGRSLSELRSVYEKMPLRPGLRGMVTALKDAQMRLAVVTSGVGLFADFMQEDYGFHGVCANSIIHRGGVVRAFGPPIVHRGVKPVYVAAYREALDVPRKECFAVGDSKGDIPMFRAVGKSIALNPAKGVRATHIIQNCTDLMQILPYIK